MRLTQLQAHATLWSSKYTHPTLNLSGLLETTLTRTKLSYLLDLVAEKGYFEGILGFSQGAAMATILLEHYRSNNIPCPFKFAIMIAGVEPKIFYPEVSDLVFDS